MKRKTFPLKIKLLAYPVLFIILPALVIGFVSTTITQRILMKRITGLNSQLVGRMQNEIDYILLSMERSIASILTSRKVQNVAGKDYSQNWEGKTEDTIFINYVLKNTVNAHTNSVAAVVLYGFAHNSIFHYGESYYDPDFKYKKWVQEAIGAGGNFIYEEPDINSEYAIELNYPFIPAARIFNDPIKKKLTLGVQILYKTEAFSNIIKSSLYGPGSRTAIINKEGKTIVFGQIGEGESHIEFLRDTSGIKIARQPVLTEILDKVATARRRNSPEKEGRLVVKENGKDTLILYSASAVNDWILVSSMPTANITSETSNIMRILWAIVIGSVLIGTFLALRFLHNNIISPVNSLMHAAKEVTTNVLASGGSKSSEQGRENLDDKLENEWNFIKESLEQMAGEIENSYFILKDKNQKLERAREELTEHTSKLEQLDKLKNEFLANTSHELKTPLNGIIGLADSMIDGASGTLTEEAIDNLYLIRLSGRRLANLVNDLLDFSRLKNNSLSIQKFPVNMREITQIVIGISKTLIGGKNLTLVNAVPDFIPPALGDENRLEQILYNLVGNSIKFSDSGEIKISGTYENGLVYISISDEGIGIPEEKFQTVFTSFEQADSSISRKYGGTGLGLAITRKLVELHKGAIWIEKSAPGRGTTITFSIPASIKKALPLSIKNRVVSHILPSSRLFSVNHRTEETIHRIDEPKIPILIADDEPINLKVLENYLKLQNFEVVQAENGFKVLELLESGFQPAVIILDIMMPRMSGYEVCKIIRKTHSPSALPILMLSAKNRIDDLETGFEAGANDYITKPFERSEIFARVNNLVSLKQASDSLMALNKNLESKIADRTREIVDINKKMIDSINYAKHIQLSILPTREELLGLFSNHFVLWKPRDIVGGDFYWAREHKGMIMLAVVDCTGHGVPGAFMSMAANTILNYIVRSAEQPDPAMVLKKLNILFKENLHRNSQDCITDDGMDVGLCIIDKDKKRLFYAGSKLILYYTKSGILHSIKGDKQSIGYLSSSEDYEYTSHLINLEPGQMFYLTTDGYIDQCGGNRNFPYGRKRFTGLLTDICRLNPEEQKIKLQEELTRYRGELKQLDDITLVGFTV